jgi:gamma-glutamylcyclotransferase (GGCT)/AIG2-like uncharacterized protein YtfP
VRGDTVRHLFVYGTLRRGTGVAQAHWLETVAVHKGGATLAGRLLDLGRYPGLLPATNGDEKVQGELYELPEDGVVLEQLDRYEGCHAEDPEPHEYCRIVCTATDEDGVRVWCWTYLYQGPAEQAKIIPGGNWLNPYSSR